jgi:hypothetical protein
VRSASTIALNKVQLETKEAIVADRKALAQQFMQLQQDQKIDDAVAMLADDVTSTNPMTGTATGKANVEAGMRSQPAGGGGFNIEWQEPTVDGDVVSIVGTGSPFGPIKIQIGFNAEDKVNKIDIGLAM